jgi:hypothetical protein
MPYLSLPSPREALERVTSTVPIYHPRVPNNTLLSAFLGDASAATLLFSANEEGETLVVVPQI